MVSPYNKMRNPSQTFMTTTTQPGAASLSRRTFALSLSLSLATVLGLAGAGVAAAGFPERPIRLVVPWGAGGLSDISVRKLAALASGELGQPVVIENHPGASGTLGTQLAVKAAPDGYTLLMASATPMLLQPLLRDARADLVKDLTPVMNYGGAYNAIVVTGGSPYRTLADLIAAGRSKPGSISYATAGNLDFGHLAILVVERKTGARFVQVPFSGGPTALTTLLGGHVDFAVVSNVGEYVRSGKLRPVGVIEDARMPDAPQAPTLREAGIDWAAPTVMGVVAPAGLPAPVKARLEDAFLRAARSQEFAAYMREIQMPLRVRDGPSMGEEMRAWVDANRNIVETLGLKRAN
jgi:tripartite-type tricarboxylate transporter receptor subunit TctC